ncbi:ankyrin repeat domain-containing protein [Halomonas sp. M1]|uniref:ankyrin repeat domain-containing protein n=1 Tax=Halomonas sp. M1 TaxID=3035470 RepID=UPI002484FB25|nr:ankyrin repeat domain-containing protein [Halomonas sp. M1]WFE72803.1 ankyrin repeat domain-containing protein [Halomonas sp. M1]
MSRSYTASEFFTGPQLEMAEAIERNDMVALRQGYEQGIDLHARGDRQITLMWFALLQENIDAVRTLVELGVHPNESPVEGGGTPLGQAFRHNDARYLEAMLDGGLSPNDATDNEGNDKDYPLIFSAITSGTLEHVKLLVERGADIHYRIREGKGQSVFDHSTLGTRPEVAIFLLEQGVEPNIRMENGVTTAWGVHLKIQNLQPGLMRDQFIRLRDMMIEHGVEFPPPTPVEVRKQMRAEGLTPRVPPGHDY